MNTSNGDNSKASPGEWHRPGPGEHRGPCPALNALANSGRLPRDGKATAAQLVTALERYLGVSRSIGVLLANAAIARLGKPGPDGVKVLDLADLGLHGFIEHDASLTRRDAKNGDASEFVPALLDQLVSLSRDGKSLTLEDLAVAHQLRMAQCAAGGQAVSLKTGLLGTAEVALLYAVLGRDGAIAIPDLVEFFQNEKLPDHFTPPHVTQPTLLKNMAVVTAMGNVPYSEAAQRARKAAQEIPEPEAARCPVNHGSGRAGG